MAAHAATVISAANMREALGAGLVAMGPYRKAGLAVITPDLWNAKATYYPWTIDSAAVNLVFNEGTLYYVLPYELCSHDSNVVGYDVHFEKVKMECDEDALDLLCCLVSCVRASALDYYTLKVWLFNKKPGFLMQNNCKVAFFHKTSRPPQVDHANDIIEKAFAVPRDRRECYMDSPVPNDAPQLEAFEYLCERLAFKGWSAQADATATYLARVVECCI